MYAFTMDNFNQILKYCPKLESLRLNIDQLFSYQLVVLMYHNFQTKYLTFTLSLVTYAF